MITDRQQTTEARGREWAVILLALWLAMMGAAMAEETASGTFVPWTNMVMSQTWDGPIMQLLDPSQTWITFPAAGVSLGSHGEVKIDGKHDLDTTAKLFWNAVARVRGQPEPFPQSEGDLK